MDHFLTSYAPSTPPPKSSRHYTSVYKWQATKCSSSTSTNSGRSNAHLSYAFGHLVLNVQPEGGFAGLGKSPVSLIFSRLCTASSFKSITGIDDSNAWVYG